ncbi:bile acid:sodium symporter family protein [Streptomyces sp. NRRL F-5126]|uniref:bile acid:sodium symporter family protein n=1 Tax=Streptomyces sp. NRRL F-5126 TaxID=1463857 RepID=UPI0004C4E5AC|nr:bile acid:sodium symporter family protein [Streptomyces sp. NRRL F-5126]
MPLRVDPYVAALLAAVLCATLWPVRGTAATVAGGVTDTAVGLVFFLYGTRLSTAEAVAGLRHWRLHLAIVASTFVMFPLAGVAGRLLVPAVLGPQLYTGFLFLCLVPSTVQSSIAFTSIAGGNVSAAVCAGTYSSLLGMVATPALAALLIGGQAPFSPGRVAGLCTQIVLPFLLGQLARGRIGAAVARHRRGLGRVDRGAVLLVVYNAFSAGVVGGVWERVPIARLLLLAVVEASLLAAALGTTSLLGRVLGFPREDRITVVFAGSKKSLVNGVPMAAVLFGPGAGPAVVPLMMFHQMQLVVCSVIAGRWARTGAGPREAAAVGTGAPAARR